jgi:hypothetical protein
MFLHTPLQTVARAYQEILAGEEPWLALGNFMNDWFIYAREHRAELIAEVPAQHGDELYQQRWATFIAASVEYLCQQSGLPCPLWVQDPGYQLETPWYHALYVDEVVRAWLQETTPEPFRRRNIYCGDRVYLDKQEALYRPA